MLYWKDNWQLASYYEFNELLLCELKKPRWIIDGNIGRTIPLRLNYCNTVIYMDFPCVQCIYGVLKRIIKNYGKSRLDMGGYCPEKFNKNTL